MPCSVHFVGNRLLTTDILRLAISILFVSCRGRKPIETSQLFRTQNNSRNSTWKCNVLNMILRNPTYTPTIFLKPIKDMQQHTVFPSRTKYFYMSRLRDTEQEVQCTSNRKLTEQFKQTLDLFFQRSNVDNHQDHRLRLLEFISSSFVVGNKFNRIVYNCKQQSLKTL